MDDDELLRYSRQILLPYIGYEGQNRLSRARALIIGLGGLGSPVALYLAAAGVGRLSLVDFDRVELTNLQRQVIHTTGRIGQLKVHSARESLAAINPLVRVDCLDHALSDAELAAAMAEADIVLDCSDNFDTRLAVNRASVATRTPLVSAAVIGMEGQLSLFDPRDPESACYHCLYGVGSDPDGRCADMGVLASLPGVMGSLQATEALKCLLGLPTITGRLLLLDAMRMEWRNINLRRDPDCPVCGGG